MKLKIRESIQRLDGGDILLTDYSGDIANLCINKPKSYRIIYNKHDDVYLIADARKYIHEEMTEIALNEGWLPKTSEFMKKTHTDLDEYDSWQSENITFLSKEDIDEAFRNIFSSDLSMSEYSYEFPVTTGAIFTKGKYSDNYFPSAFPELFSKMKRYAVDNNYSSSDDVLWNEF